MQSPGRPDDVDWARLIRLLRESHAASSTGPWELEDIPLDQPDGDYARVPSQARPAGLLPSSSGQPLARAHLQAAAPASAPSAPAPASERLQSVQQQLQQHAPRGAADGPHPRGLQFLGQLGRRTQAAAAAAASMAAAAAASGTEAGDDAMSLSASAELHRLTTETPGISLQAMSEWVAEMVPFALLLLWVFVFKHFGTLFLTTLLGGCIVHVNADIRRLIAARREARVRACLGQALSVAGLSISVVGLTLPDGELLRALTLRGSAESLGAMDALLLVLLADSLLRFASLAPKLVVVAWFRSRQGGGGGGSAGDGGGGSHLSGARQARQQTRVLTVVERAASLYRSALPTAVWYGYFIRSFSPVVGSLFCGFYLVTKASSVAAHVRLLALAVLTATRQSAMYGTYVGRDDSGESGGLGACPVCQDPVSTPVRLHCGHVFCEECILEWLERDKTCPMCRAQVRPMGLPACSDGASPLLPTVF